MYIFIICWFDGVEDEAFHGITEYIYFIYGKNVEVIGEFLF